MKLLKQIQYAELADAERAIAEKIHRQFLEGAKLQSVLSRPDNFFNEVSLEGASDTFNKLQLNLQTKLEDIISIQNKKVDLQTAKKLLDNGSILIEWNSLADIVISPKTKSNIAEQITAKIYSLEDTVNKICYEYQKILTSIGTTAGNMGLMMNADLYKAYSNQFISGIGIYLVMQKQLLLKSISKITLNQIKDLMAPSMIRKIFIDWDNTPGNPPQSFMNDNNKAGYIGHNVGTKGPIKKIIVDNIVKMFDDSAQATAIATTKEEFRKQLESGIEKVPKFYDGRPELVYNDPSIQALNPIYAKMIKDADERVEVATPKYSPQELIDMGQKNQYNPFAVSAMMQLGQETNARLGDIETVFDDYYAKYSAPGNGILEAEILTDSNAMRDIIIDEYNKFGKKSALEVADKRQELEDNQLAPLFVANPRSTIQKRARFKASIKRGKVLAQNYINNNYNYKIDEIMGRL